MRQKILGVLAVFGLLLGSPVASSCTFDLDCDIGSECVKSPDASSGSCVGGLFPGNDSDTAFSGSDLGGSDGSCSFDSDCGVGSICNKLDGIFGRCVSEVASSCSYDADCGSGSLCVIPSGALIGACVSNLFPDDGSGMSGAPGSNGSSGDTCYFNSDCGGDAICSKGTGVYGICIGNKARVDPFKQP